MKTRIFFLFMTILTFPATVLAVDLYGSYEARGAILHSNEITLGEAFNDVHTGPVLKLGDNYAFKAGLGVGFDEVFDLKFFYSEMSDKSKNHNNQFAHSFPLAGKFGTIAPIVLPNKRPHPNDESLFARQGNFYRSGFDGLEFGTGSASSEYGIKIVDLEFGRNFKLNDGMSFRLMFGARYAKYEQSLRVIRGDECVPPWHRPQLSGCPKDGRGYAYWVKDGVFFGSERHLDQKIDGFGPRFGLSIIIPIRNTNLSLVSSSSYSVLFATKDVYDTFLKNKTTYKNANNKWVPTTTEVVNILYRRNFGPEDKNNISISNEDVTIHNFEIENAFQLDFKISEQMSLIFTAGYKYSIHFGALNSYGESLKDDPGGVFWGRYPDAVGATVGDKEDDLISHGPFIKVGLKF